MNLQTCRSCRNSNLTKILDLGFAPPSNALLDKEDLLKGETYYPLVLLFCEGCMLVQTQDFHAGEDLFTPDYPYLSSTSSTWIAHSQKLVKKIVKDFNLDGNSLVAEVASNDGYLLESLINQGIPNYGIEPTRNAADISISKGHKVYRSFLNSKTASRIKREQGSADVVIANNVFAHVPDLQDFTKATKSLLSHEGVLIVEVQNFAQLVKYSLFDTVYHEHYSYFTVTSLYNLLKQFGLGIFKVEFPSTHGGSIRVFARNNMIPNSLSELISNSLEDEYKAISLDELSSFQDSVNKKKKKIKEFLYVQKSSGNIIAGLGAAAKGNTLINFLALSEDDIKFVFDSAPSKQGKFLPGSHIPIHPFSSISEFTEVGTFLTLPWNISEELARQANLAQIVRRPIYRLLPRIELIQT